MKRGVRVMLADSVGLAYAFSGQDVFSKFCPTNPSGCCSNDVCEALKLLIFASNTGCFAHDLRHVQSSGQRHDDDRCAPARKAWRQVGQLRGGLRATNVGFADCSSKDLSVQL